MKDLRLPFSIFPDSSLSGRNSHVSTIFSKGVVLQRKDLTEEQKLLEEEDEREDRARRKSVSSQLLSEVERTRRVVERRASAIVNFDIEQLKGRPLSKKKSFKPLDLASAVSATHSARDKRVKEFHERRGSQYLIRGLTRRISDALLGFLDTTVSLPSIAEQDEEREESRRFSIGITANH